MWLVSEFIVINTVEAHMKLMTGNDLSLLSVLNVLISTATPFINFGKYSTCVNRSSNPNGTGLYLSLATIKSRRR